MGWLEDRLSSLDRRNQSVADYLLDHPEAGTRIDPYAKSERGRRLVIVAVAAVALATIAFGWLGLAVVGVLAAGTCWRLDHHPWLDGYERRDPPQPSL